MFKKIAASRKFWLIAGLVVLAGGAAAYLWHSGAYQLGGTAAVRAEISNIIGPEDSYVSGEKIIPQSVFIHFSREVLKPSLVGKKIVGGIKLFPDLRGNWQALSASVLSFTPESDWLPGGEYQVKLSKSLFNNGVRLKSYEAEFEAPQFRGEKTAAEFYEDPQDSKKKQATATFRFNYPLDEKSLKDKISVKTVSGSSYDFTYKTDDAGRTLYVVSAPLKIGEKEDFAVIRVNGAGNAYNQEKLKKDVGARVKVPSSSTFFKLKRIHSEIVPNSQHNDNPEQLLYIEFSTAVNGADLQDKLKFFEWEKSCYEVKANSEAKPDKQVKIKRMPLYPTPVETGMPDGRLKVFKYDVRERQHCLEVDISKGLQAVEGYVLAQEEKHLIDVAEYPLSAKIGFEGAVLPLKGEKKLALVSRGVDEIKVQLARIDSAQLNHLVTQTGGDFSHPYFRNYNFNENNIAEIFEQKLKINMQNPAEENYSSVDLKPYVQDKKGIFIIKVLGSKDNYYYSDEDKRLITVTDLGIIAKDNVDRSHDLFVASITDGKPVVGAEVEVLGRNGLKVLGGKTDSSGRLHLPDFSSFANEKEPVAYKVSFGGDVSYLPLHRRDRVLDFSRFEVGGVYEDSASAESLNAFLFSDRGIYRPGEEVHLGIAVRQVNLGVPDKMPLRLEIRNPNGEITAVKRFQSDEFGFSDYTYTVPATARLGKYNASVYQIKNKDDEYFIGASDFRVEEFQPDNLRIKLNLKGVEAKGWFTASELKGSVQLDNLYGKAAAGHSVKVAYSLSPSIFSFKEYPGFVFRDPLRSQNQKSLPEYKEEITGLETDGEGTAQFAINLSKFEQGSYRLMVSAEGFEADSGKGVLGTSGALVSPNKFLVGWKADGSLDFINKNAKRGVELIAVDNKLQRIAPSDLTVAIYSRKFVSTLVQMPNGTYRYQMLPKEEKLSETPFALTTDKTVYDLDTTQPGSYFMLLSDSEGRELAKVFYEVAGAENTAGAIDKEAGLDIKLDRGEYNAGDTVRMQITAPYAGFGLITIERDKVYSSKWFKADGKSVVEEIQIPDDVEGNAYINVAWVRDGGAEEIFLPPLSYAAVPFEINKNKRTLQISLETPQTVRPGDEMAVAYRCMAPSKIVVYGVNTGILQVAKYKLPNPLGYFMDKNALQVVTAQIMDLIMPDIGLLRTLKAAGGDASYELAALAQNLNPFARRQDKPAAFWSGILDCDELTGDYSYKVPEYFNGEMTVMAVGVSKEAFGRTQQNVTVKGDFALLPSGPLNVVPGDESTVAVNIANLVEASGPNLETKIRLEVPDALKVIGADEAVVKLDEGAETTISFKVKAGEVLGSAEMMLRAEDTAGRGFKAAMPYSLSIRPANPYVNDAVMGFAPGKLVLKDFLKPMFEEFRSQTISASASPLVLAEGLLQFLNKFPHGCTEQTISKIFPAMEIFYRSPELIKDMDVYALFDNAVAALRQRQQVDGGFSAWPGGSGSDEFVSLYAAEFLSEAQKRGFNVPEGLRQKALEYAQTVAAREPKSVTDSNPAYAIYILSKAGEVTTNYLLNLEEQLNHSYGQKWQQGLTPIYMGAAYAMLQDRAKAERLTALYQLGKDSSQDARYLTVMGEYFPERLKNMGKQAVESLLKPLQSGNYTTISAAEALRALNAVGGKSEDTNIRFKGLEADYGPFAKVELGSDNKTVEISSSEPFYYNIVQQGFEKGNPQQDLSEGLVVSKEYMDEAGKPLQNPKLGDVVTIKISFMSQKNEAISDVAIVDLLPGNMEIIKDSIKGEGLVDYSEAREDRALIYTTATPKLQEVTYKAKITAKGKFTVPAVYASALYDATVKAHSKVQTIDVED